MQIRLAGMEDVPAVLDLGAAMAEESRFREYGFNREKTEKVIINMIRQPGQAVVLLAVRQDASVAGMLAGYVVDLFFSDAIVAQDRFFYVHPDARGSPVALKLLLAFRSWAEKRNAQELNINMSVGIEMERFNRMMGKLGFKCCGSNFSLTLGQKS